MMLWCSNCLSQCKNQQTQNSMIWSIFIQILIFKCLSRCKFDSKDSLFSPTFWSETLLTCYGRLTGFHLFLLCVFIAIHHVKLANSKQAVFAQFWSKFRFLNAYNVANSISKLPLFLQLFDQSCFWPVIKQSMFSTAPKETHCR